MVCGEENFNNDGCRVSVEGQRSTWLPLALCYSTGSTARESAFLLREEEGVLGVPPVVGCFDLGVLPALLVAGDACEWG